MNINNVRSDNNLKTTPFGNYRSQNTTSTKKTSKENIMNIKRQ